MENSLRKWMQIVEFFKLDDDGEPRLTWHMINATTASIDKFDVPEDKRGLGIGTAYYQRWEDALPPAVTSIEMWVMDVRAMRFWTKVGFVQKHQFSDAEIDHDGTVMVKQLTG